MKVLHIWNTAGVGSLISKSLNKKGIESNVVMRSQYDPFKMTEYYNDISLNVSGGSFISTVIDMANDYDIIHVHGIAKILERLKNKYPSKKIILQHHGTELTIGNMTELIHQYKFCDSIITSTNDLHQVLNGYNIKNTLIENAVDTDLFKPIECKKSNDALMFDIRYVDTESSLDFVRNVIDWKIDIVDRESNSVLYHEMPKLLNQYNKFIDVKCYEWLNGNVGQAHSKTGREALACGLKVLNYKGDIVQGLPFEYSPEYQVEKIIELYRS